MIKNCYFGNNLLRKELTSMYHKRPLFIFRTLLLYLSIYMATLMTGYCSTDIAFQPHLISNSVDGANMVCSSDLDNDNDPDILSVSIQKDRIVWFENQGGNPIQFVLHEIYDPADFALFVYAEDLDGDGILMSSLHPQKMIKLLGMRISVHRHLSLTCIS